MRNDPCKNSRSFSNMAQASDISSLSQSASTDPSPYSTETEAQERFGLPLTLSFQTTRHGLTGSESAPSAGGQKFASTKVKQHSTTLYWSAHNHRQVRTRASALRAFLTSDDPTSIERLRAMVLLTPTSLQIDREPKSRILYALALALPFLIALAWLK